MDGGQETGLLRKALPGILAAAALLAVHACNEAGYAAPVPPSLTDEEAAAEAETAAQRAQIEALHRRWAAEADAFHDFVTDPGHSARVLDMLEEDPKLGE